jgi:hypothetical protein
MWQISELIPFIPSSSASTRGRIFFAIYYISADNAFKNAAQCWLRQVKARHVAGPNDTTIERQISSESDFVAAWELVNSTAKEKQLDVYAGNILTHASLQSENGTGLEFKGGTLEHLEIVSLKKLPWASNGFLILAGCNTALVKDRNWAPAHSFALKQGVPTVGQNGYAYFSKTWVKYSEKSETDTEICLWSYSRGKNNWLGGGGRVSGIVFRP